MLLSHVGWQMWSGVIIWLYQICQVATLLPPPQRVLYFTLTLQPQSKWIRTQPQWGLAAAAPFVTPHFPPNPGQLTGWRSDWIGFLKTASYHKTTIWLVPCAGFAWPMTWSSVVCVPLDNQCLLVIMIKHGSIMKLLPELWRAGAGGDWVWRSIISSSSSYWILDNVPQPQ